MEHKDNTTQSSEAKLQYEAKKEERQREKDATIKSSHVKNTSGKTLRVLVWLVILGAIVYGLFLLIQTQIPKSEDFSVAYEIQGRDHIPTGTVGFEYNSNPPSSGPHYPTTAPLGFYDVDEPVLDGHLIHNLEHGEIWIAYKPSISEDVRNELKKLAGGRVAIVPREANEFDISILAWGRVDSFNLPENGELDMVRLSDFIKRYQNKGPESGIPATHR